MKYLLDPDHLSILQQQSGAEFAALSVRLSGYSMADFALSVVTFHEQVIGCHAYLNRARDNRNLERGYAMLNRMLRDFSRANVLPFDAGVSSAYESLITLRLRMGKMDLRIAATALSSGLILLTRNTRDFERVPGLRIEDWTL